MKSSSLLWLPLVALLQQTHLAYSQDTGSELAKCATQCLASELPKSGCTSPDDIACICGSKEYAAAVGTCSQASCTVRESLAVRKYLTNQCDMPIRNEGRTPTRASWALFAFALVFIVGRFVFRASGSSYGYDDWTALFSLGVLLPIDILVNLMVNEGLGQDMWMLEPLQITDILKDFWIAEFLSVWLMGATKISVLLLYLRIWQPPKTRTSKFRVTCWVLVGLMVVFVVIYSVVLGDACSPIEYTWWRWDQPREGECVDTIAQIYSIATVNIILDVLICCLPLPKCWQLSMSMCRRLGVSFMFGFGLVVTICSIVRFHYLVEFVNSPNPTWDYNRIVLWSSIECNLSVICICLPAMAGLLQRVWKQGIGSLGSSGSGSGSAPPTIIRSNGIDDHDARPFSSFGMRMNSLGKEGKTVIVDERMMRSHHLREHSHELEG